MTGSERTTWCGLLERRGRWSLTWPARLLLLACLAAMFACAVFEVHPFLAPTERVASSVLVIEGWQPPYAMKQVVEEFRTGHYQRAVLVRTIIDLDDKYESGREAGEYLVSLLAKYQVPADKITSLYPLVARKDRTYHSALELKKWLAEQRLTLDSLNVITMGPHARRTRLLYEKAFGDRVKIGIIAMDNLEYDKTHWWRASEGVREVLSETIAYLYARFLFSPQN